jgi:hypothetical protein
MEKAQAFLTDLGYLLFMVFYIYIYFKTLLNCSQ